MQDAYVWRRLIAENTADRDTADGRPATRAYAFARLARMQCADAETFAESDADQLADAALHAQWQTAAAAIERVVEGRPAVERIVLAGSGEILGCSVCERKHDWHRMPRNSLAEMLDQDLSVAACAYAVAMLAAKEDDA